MFFSQIHSSVDASFILAILIDGWLIECKTGQERKKKKLGGIRNEEQWRDERKANGVCAI